MILKNCYPYQDGRCTARADLRIEDGRYTAIAPELEARPQEEVIDLQGAYLFPAFYNLHTHIPMSLLRGWGEGLPLQRWLEEKMFPFEATLTEEEAYWGTLLSIAELLRSGCCAFTDMYFLDKAIVKACQESGIKANLGRGVNFLPDGVPLAETLMGLEEAYLLQVMRDDPNGRLRTDASIHAEYTNTEYSARQVLAFAEEHQLSIHLHLSETASEHAACKERHGGLTPLGWFHSLGYFRRPLILAHCVQLEDSDYELLKREIADGADITLVHNISSNLKLGSGFADLKRWVEAGVRICLGTDGAASNNNLNMLEEAHLAAMVQKGLSHDPLFCGPQQVLQWLTEDGALAQGRPDCGRIALGYRADCFAIDLDGHPATVPCYDAPANLLYAAEAAQIFLTLVDGAVVYRDGRYTGFDIDRVLSEVKRIAQAKKAHFGV